MDRPPATFLSFARDALMGLADEAAILDVGGGGEMRVPGVRARLTVIDNSPEALERHTAAHETLIGDAQRFDYGDRRFDAAIFWNVLEHLADPAEALRRACATVRDGGLVIVRGPTLDSGKALITRWTPHRLHVVFYRRVSGIKTAGQPGYAPFPVEHRPAATIDRMSAQLTSLGFEQIFFQAYVGNQTEDLQRFSSIAFRLFGLASAALRGVTGGRYGRMEDEFVMIWRRPARAEPGTPSAMAIAV